MKKILISLPILWLCLYCVPLDQSSSQSTTGKVLTYDNRQYESDIRTVMLHPFKGNVEDEIQPAAIHIRQSTPLLLSFDHLHADYENFKVKIFHCNRDWSKSNLNENEYLNAFNEFPINEYETSFNTRTSYIHYRFIVPQVKLTGNYLLIVYRDNNPNDLILSRRFIVYDQAVGISPKIEPSSNISYRSSHQQVTFSIDYRNIDIYNPHEEVKVTLMQNERWDNAIAMLRPTFARESERLLEYEHFDLSSNFTGGNEFRFFDMRTINYSGQNVSGIRKGADRIDAFIMKDKDRGKEAYAEVNDINGNYVINNLESSPPDITADYVHVHFFLETEKTSSSPVYIAGQFNNWAFDKANKLEYDASLKGYTGTLLLKQGWYNYLYYVPRGEDPYLYEGSHYQTSNQYTFLVYYRPQGGRYDQVIGYLNYNY